MRGSLRIFFVFSVIEMQFFIAEYPHAEWQKNLAVLLEISGSFRN
jgi:hypothetical protein